MTTTAPPTDKKTRETAEFIIKELARFRAEPPFISYVRAKNHQAASGENPEDHFFIARHARPSSPSASADNVNYVSYKAPTGRLAAALPGRATVVSIQKPHGLGCWNDTYTVLVRALFDVCQAGTEWDARNNRILFPEVVETELESLIEFLARPEAPTGPSKPKRRRSANKFELRDLAIVDSVQDGIFRLPISAFLLITGAPGTGKTTVAIKRLAQKTKLEYLLDEEKAGLSDDKLRRLFSGPNTWALFMPNELLRNYLKEALAQEQLAASDDHLLVWNDHKITIARDALRYLKVGDRGFFKLGRGLLQSGESRYVAKWTNDFQEFFNTCLNEEFVADFNRQSQSAAFAISKIAEEMNTIKARITFLDMQIARTAVGSPLSEGEARQPISKRPEAERSDLLEQLRLLESANAAWQRISQIAISVQQNPAQWGASRINRIMGDVSVEINNLRQRRNIRPALVDLFEHAITLASKYSSSQLIQRIPAIYQQFRLNGNARLSFYKPSALDMVKDRIIEVHELDTLIYTALSFIRRSSDVNEILPGQGDQAMQWVVNEFRTVVVVDEAADFSATELACMYMLAHPAFNSVTLAGDLMQRMTREGLGSWTDLALLLPAFDERPLSTSYRQSARLLRVADNLYREFIGEAPPFSSAFSDDNADPEPLLFLGSDKHQTADWIADRIIEIYRQNREQLPSIAIFVPTETDITELHELLAPKLFDHSISTDACFGGKVLGTQAKVRIFNVKFIKGLEFEAVFFTSIDRMARNEPELIDKYLYVGLTRARNFLALTCGDQFPQRLDFIKAQFRSGNWQTIAPE